VKYFGLVVIFCSALALSACGGSDSSAEAGTNKTEADKSNAIKPFEPDIEPPKTLPKKLIINDLKEGSGPPAEPGDELKVEYIAINEKGEKEFYSIPGSGFEFELGTGNYWPGWEKGVEGMKVGGRREILMPATMTKNQGYLFYIVDLLEIKEPKPEAAKEAES